MADLFEYEGAAGQLFSPSPLPLLLTAASNKNNRNDVNVTFPYFDLSDFDPSANKGRLIKKIVRMASPSLDVLRTGDPY